MAETTQQRLAGLIDAFNKAWVRPERWNEDQLDERSVRLREMWAIERDRWTVNLLDLIRTWLLWPDDGPDATDEQGLPSWRQNVAKFRDNMVMAAEAMEMEMVKGLDEE